jgi:hypothetical protein
MERDGAFAYILALALVAAGCLGGLRYDREAEAIASAPHGPLRLPVRENRAYWLLRGEAGWQAAHEIRYGGDPGDEALFLVRAVRFRDEQAAIRAFARLGYDYLFRIYRDRMVRAPSPMVYPEPLPGDESLVGAFMVRFPGNEWAEEPLYGQITAIRSGAVVILVESIGVEPARFVPAVDTIIHTAKRVSVPDP